MRKLGQDTKNSTVSLFRIDDNSYTRAKGENVGHFSKVHKIKYICSYDENKSTLPSQSSVWKKLLALLSVLAGDSTSIGFMPSGV